MTTSNNQAAASNGNVQQPQQNGVQRFTENTVDNVLQRVASFQTAGELRLPANYSPENAVRSAWLIIQETKNTEKRPALEVCTKESIANALLDMVLQGLSPVKKQCYFVVYANKLVMQKSYIGTIAVSKRVANVKEVKAIPIYEGDTFKYSIDLETGRKKITEHVQDFENIDPDKTKGAYAIVTLNDGSIFSEIMNMKQITAAWNMGNAKGQSPAHKGFKDEMSCKTVINRALKTAIGSSDDGDLFDEPVEPQDPALANVTHQIQQNANKNEIGFSDHEDMGNVDTTTGEVIETMPANIQQQAVQQTAQPAQQQEQSQPASQQTLGGPGF